MTKLTQQQIRDLARRMVGRSPGGIRYSELVEQIATQHIQTPRNTIHGSVWDLATRYPEQISKPSRGLFMPAGVASGAGKTEPKEKPPEPTQERAFYKSFADFLEKDLDEVTIAAELGGAGLKSKWGTPDVVGVYKARAADIVKFYPEVVSAELKIDPRSSIEAFGQAIAYRLFSTKSYIVMPTTISEEDKSRLEALCMLFGIGFVLFAPDPSHPKYTIRTKAQRFTPDTFYVNTITSCSKSCSVDVCARPWHQISSGRIPVLFARRTRARGPTSSPSW